MAQDRDREISELRARLAALESDKPPQSSQPVPAPKTGNGCLPAVLISVAAVVVLALLLGQSGPPSAGTEDKPLRGCDEAWANTYTAQLVGGAGRLIRGSDVSRTEGLVVLVRPGPWSRLDYAQQQTLAAAFDCAIAGTGGHLSAIRFRHERSGADLASWDAVALLRLREDGFGEKPAN